jgi:hydroxyacylglutathione hydrolase
MDEVPRDERIYVFCGSGLRSMMAASLLERQGYSDLFVILGGVAGWTSTTCPLSL